MNEVVIVAGKELRELFGRWRSPRATLLQTAVVFFLGGVFFPAFGPAPWSDLGAAATFYFVLPSAMAGMAAADAFAGERERRTLETLLATPLSDAAIVVGKIATAVLFGVGVGAATLLSAIVVTNLAFPAQRPLLPPGWLAAGLLGGTAGSAFLVASCGVAISMRVLVARSAQQLTNLVSMVIAVVVVGVAGRWNAAGSPAALATLDGILGALGVLATVGAVATFGRDRLYDPTPGARGGLFRGLRAAAAVLVAPRRTMAWIAAEGRATPALVVGTAIAATHGLVWIRHVNLVASSRAALLERGAGFAESALEQAAEAGARILGATLLAGAVLVPALQAVALAGAVWLLLRWTSRSAPLRSLVVVAAYGLLPLQVARAAALAAIGAGAAGGLGADGLLPWSLGAVISGADASSVLVRAAGAVDPFSAWAVVLVAEGVHVVGAVRRGRALAMVTGVAALAAATGPAISALLGLSG